MEENTEKKIVPTDNIPKPTTTNFEKIQDPGVIDAEFVDLTESKFASSVKESFSKVKINLTDLFEREASQGLSHFHLAAIGAGATAASLGVFALSKRNKGKPTKHPRNDVDRDYKVYRGNSDLKYKYQGNLGTGVMAGALSIFPKNKNLSGLLLYGGYGLGTMLQNSSNNVPLDKSMVAVGAAIAAGKISHHLGSVYIPKGLKSFKEFAAINLNPKLNESILGALSKVAGAHPILAKLLSSESAGLIAAVASFPMAHTLMGKALNFHKHNHRDKSPQLSQEPNRLHNYAGRTGGRSESGPEFRASRHSEGSQLNINSSIRTHYNESNVIESFS
jgi:hypothetical protein